MTLILPQRGRIRQPAAGGGGVTSSFLGNTGANSTVSTITVSGAALGAADSDRKILVTVFAQGDSSPNVSSLSVGGETAALVSGTSQATNLSSVTLMSDMFQAAVPLGTTGDIVVTWPSSVARYGIIWWRLVGAGASFSNGIVNSDANFSGQVSTTNSFTVPTGGNAFLAAFLYNPVTQGVTFSDTLFDVEDFNAVWSGNMTYAAARSTVGNETGDIVVTSVATSGSQRLITCGCVFG